jgi:CBS domain-containing protein
MSPPPVSASPAALVAAFIDEVVLHQPYSTYPLEDADGRLSGLVTLNRIRRVPQPQRATTRLSDIACPPSEVPTAGPDEPLVDLLPRLAGCVDGRAVVTGDDGRVLAVVSPRDIAQVAAVADLRGGGEPLPPAGLAAGDYPPGRTSG